MNSAIDSKEVVENTEHKFGEVMKYYPCLIDGEPALFTRFQLDEAILRGRHNPEDIPGNKNFWQFLGL